MARTAKQWFPLVLLAVFAGAGSVSAQTQPPAVDLSKLSEEATGWLQDLVRINTTNPPGNELAAAKYLAEILTREGISNEIFESAPGRGFLVARLNANAVPDPSRALLLMGHLDVVGAQKEKWSVDPFGGVIKDGYLYGRGTIDDKGMTVENVAVLVALKRGGARLERDVILLAEGDEEQNGEFGMDVAVHKYWDKIAAAYSLNEGGRVTVKGGKVQSVEVQASEKVSIGVDVIATGASGHASMPLKDNAVTHLAAAVAKIGAYEAPVQLSAITRTYFEELAKVEDEETAKWMRALEMPDRMEHAARWLSAASPVWNAMLRDTIAPTILQAGVRRNVVPSEARATINIRLLPGDSIDPLLASLKDLVNDPQIRFAIQPDVGMPAPSSSPDSELFQAIVHVTSQVFPGAEVVPYLSPYGTDSAVLRVRNVQAYGLLPFPLIEADHARMHADDERIPLDSFRKGIDYLYRIVLAFATSK